MDKAVKKAYSTLRFLCRNPKLSNEQIKSAAYFSMVLKAYHRVLLKSLEPLYQGIMRICQQSGNGATMCSQVSPTCTTKPVVTSMLDHGLVDRLADKYHVAASTRTCSLDSSKFLKIPFSRDYFKFSFFPRTVCRWNSLPANVAEAPSLVFFKRERLFQGSDYC